MPFNLSTRQIPGTTHEITQRLAVRDCEVAQDEKTTQTWTAVNHDVELQLRCVPFTLSHRDQSSLLHRRFFGALLWYTKLIQSPVRTL